MKKPTKILAFVLTFVLLSGCSWLAPHKRDIQQGNLLDEDSVEQLEVGMRQDQVKYLLGTPLVTPLDNPEQWDYIYQLRRGQELKARKRVSVFFEQADDGQLRVARIDHRENQVNVDRLDELTPSAEIGAPTADDLPAPPGQPDPQQTEPQEAPQ